MLLYHHRLGGSGMLQVPVPLLCLVPASRGLQAGRAHLFARLLGEEGLRIEGWLVVAPLRRAQSEAGVVKGLIPKSPGIG
eukprot:scaffold72753_cov35-Tisochrysis_lutea.AAC.2